ncbi:MAG: DUF935 family protein [Methanosphaera sp.]|nr:DUF935 family protein [Methanosphaera sp.]
MSLINNIKELFTKEAITTNVSTKGYKNFHRISLGDNVEQLTYHQGLQVLEDLTVTMSYDILKYILSSKQYMLIANTSDTDNVVCDFIEDMLFNMETELNEIVKRQIEAIPWGYHIEEQIFDINSEGKLVLTNCIPLDMKTLQYDPFTYDDDGELVSIHQEYNGEVADIPINKVLKYTFGDYNNDYGHGILIDVRPFVEDKMNITNWLLTFLERHSLPSLVGKTSNPNSRDAMLNAFEDMRDGTLGMTIGETDEVQVLESSHHGETFFNSLSYYDNQIVKRFYIGDLIMGNSNDTGSYARSNTQLQFTQLVFDGILEEIANCFQKQVINPIVEWNYGDRSLAPTISFDKFTTGDLAGLFNTIKPLIDSGVIDSENKAVQDSIALLIKKETGLTYINEEPIMPEEDFEYQEPVNGEYLTDTILTDLDAITE